MDDARRTQLWESAGLTLLAGVLLVACATPAVRPNAGASVNEYAANLSQQRFGLSLKPAPGTPRGLASDFAWVLEPVNQFCSNAGGQLKVARQGSLDRVPVPTELDCVREGRVLWGFVPGAFNGNVILEGPGGRLFVTLSPGVLSESDVADRRKSELAAKAGEALAIEAKRQQDRAENLRQAELQAQADQRAAEFRKNLKPGDRFLWWAPPGRYIAGVGIVIRLEGELAFVQFDNLKISGQTTRYIPRKELRPMEGAVPQGKFEID